MEIELVRRISFDELNETLFYSSFKDERAETSRREFIKTLVVGSSGLLVPMGLTQQASAAFPLVLVPAIIGFIRLFAPSDAVAAPTPAPVVIHNNVYNHPKSLSRSEAQDLNCKFHLVNDDNQTAKGLLACKLDHKMEPDLAYETISEKSIKVAVPKGYTDEYRASLAKSSISDGSYVFDSKTKQSHKKIRYIVG